jgi:hypothetical protein
MVPNSEGGRIARILEQSRNCTIQENLVRARLFQGGNSCVPCKVNIRRDTDTQSESSYLASRTNCYSYVRAPVVPESVRIARVQEAVLSNEINALLSNTRFAEYAPAPTIFVCPPITYSNGSVPTKCPLPNTPLNSVLQ